MAVDNSDRHHLKAKA
jgi:hypothetical protein